MKKALIIVAIIAIIAIAGSMIYYFVFFRTEIEKAELKLQQEKEAEEILRKESLEKCLKEAEKKYSENWDKTCKQLGLPAKSPLPPDQAEWIYKKYQDNINNCYKQYGN